jgi:hypothetical protein
VRIVPLVIVAAALACSRVEAPAQGASAPPAPDVRTADVTPATKPAAPRYPVQEKLPDDLPDGATVHGKYSGLIRVVPAPDENIKQGGFRDLGRLEASPTPAVTDLVDVNWVYSAPNWYVWLNASDAPLEAPPGADAAGKYRQLLRRFAAVDDLAEYGGFFDAGFRRTTEYKGLRDLPPGYWLYYAPYWYVWAEAQPLPLEAPEKARVDGTYDRLLRVIPAPDDARTLGAFRNGGRMDRTAYKGLTGIPPGYWVYVEPSWYVWGVNTKVPAPTP